MRLEILWSIKRPPSAIRVVANCNAPLAGIDNKILNFSINSWWNQLPEKRAIVRNIASCSWLHMANSQVRIANVLCDVSLRNDGKSFKAEFGTLLINEKLFSYSLRGDTKNNPYIESHLTGQYIYIYIYLFMYLFIYLFSETRTAIYVTNLRHA